MKKLFLMIGAVAIAVRIVSVTKSVANPCSVRNLSVAPDLATKYGINSIPTLFLFKDDKLAAQAVGFMQKPGLECVISQ